MKNNVSKRELADDTTTVPAASSVAGLRRSSQLSALPGGLADAFGRLPATSREGIATAVRNSRTATEALAPVIGYLVGGDDAKKTAIVRAFLDNEKLNAQWQKAYVALKEQG